MMLLAILLLALVTVPLLGGRLGRLVDLDLRYVWLVAAAIGVQILIISIIPNRFESVHRPLHFVSYGLAAAFVVLNIRIPGFWLIGLGGMLNLIAISANGGVMPASEVALGAAGVIQDEGEFVNSGIVEDPKLLFLGDIFAVPDEVPVLDTVFSVGDVAIALGTVILVHGVCASKLVWWRRDREQGSSRSSTSSVEA